VHNTNLCKRAPVEVLEAWQREHRVSGVSAQELAPFYDSVERELSVREIPEVDRNPNNRVLERALQVLGWRGGGLFHNRVGCQKAGFCELGCPFNAKQNAAKVLIPRAVEHGARIVCDARVDSIRHDGNRVQGVLASALAADGSRRGELRVDAEVVVVAGSAIGSSALLLRSALSDPDQRLGAGLHLHPGVAVAGLFDDTLEGWKGIPQSVECTEFLDFRPGSDKRIWITTAFAHPIGTAVMLPGFGAAHRQWMVQYPKLAALTAMVHDETAGRVRVARNGRPRIEYQLGEGDRQQLESGIKACARLLFAGGARKVLVPRIPALVLESPAAIDGLPAVVRAHRVPLTSVHPMGGACFGDDPRRSVVDSTGEHHRVKGLFVCDGSLFPTSIGVPPQLSIYALARRTSAFIAKRFGATPTGTRG
jgi:choline dehydrogenase-like flavoprotein